ncbi:sugar isomerase [Enterococcus sp. JM4C]|uniref:MurR/RpiR family transcriptional regulator n=1 Tax=Candidatus Enterococcus huntleyi TaxID=1857217 RepID=UPI00137AD704|nr:MurR/RpiR family transcriptional regulator [Enterococcus sp. JM4C]KAF1298441.1 sugar isomerase [Enterococcus sp. JM4C]
MLTIEKMETIKFSPTEKAVINYILEKKEAIKKMTIREICDDTFSSPAILIRIAKKMNFDGWSTLKEALLKDFQYLSSNFSDIEPNTPFTKNDGVTTITNKIASLYQSTIQDSLSLLDHDTMQQSLDLLLNSTEIKIFGNNVNLLITQDFAHKMNRIRCYTSVSQIDGEQLFDAVNCRDGATAIVISYSGETERVLDILPILKKRNIPILAITSLGDNSLAQAADCVLNITTRERLYSKIGNMTPNISIQFILDCIYSCVFAKHYDENLDHVIQTSQLCDPRISTTSIMKELH